MQVGGSDLHGYNCQVAVDRDHQLIMAVGGEQRSELPKRSG